MALCPIPSSSSRLLYLLRHGQSTPGGDHYYCPQSSSLNVLLALCRRTPAGASRSTVLSFPKHQSLVSNRLARPFAPSNTTTSAAPRGEASALSARASPPHLGSVRAVWLMETRSAMTSPLRPSPRFGHPSYLGLDSDDAAGTTSFLADLGGRGTSGGGLFFGTPARFAGQQHLDLGQQWPTPFRDLANTALPASLSSPQHAGSSTFPTTHPQAFSPVSGHQALRPSAAMSRGASAPADCSPRRPPTDSASGFDAHLSPGAPLAGAAQPSVARRRSLNQAGGGSTSGLRSFDLQRYDMPPFTVYGRQVSPSGRIASKSALFPYHPERQEESADGTNIPRASHVDSVWSALIRSQAPAPDTTATTRPRSRPALFRRSASRRGRRHGPGPFEASNRHRSCPLRPRR